MHKRFAMAFAVAAAVFAGVLLAPARAQNFPDHPVKLIVAYPPGGPTDTVARLATQGLDAELGQGLVIENVAGAGGRIGSRDVARAAPDGYTLLLGGSNDNAIAPALYKNIDYDPVKDFAPVAALATDSQALVVNPAVPVHSLDELIRYAKDNPGKLSSGATLGISPHLLLELIRARSGTDIVFVPYKGAAPAIADVLGNQIQLHVSAKSALLPLIQSGKLRALAVTSNGRWPELPDVPTLHESGLDGFPPAIWFTLMAPAATPADVIAKLNAAENARLKSPETAAALAKLGLEPRVMTPQALASVLAGEVQLWQAVVQETGVKLE
jgi:tripartite-type tricarboxylate transporter receptor subunit TctC